MTAPDALFSDDVLDLAARLIARAGAEDKTITVAESCTGGLLGGAITAVSGASAVFGSGFLTYSNAAKTDILGVQPRLLAQHGAVSEPVADAMARGALDRSGADLSVAITGVAGPNGGTPDKPVGTVCFCVAQRDGPARAATHAFAGHTRHGVRMNSVRAALIMLNSALVGG